MFKFTIITIGKNKEKWLQEALFEYEKRLQKKACFNWVFVKDENSLIKTALRQKKIMVLDAAGKALKSISLAEQLKNWLEKNGCRLTIVIGGDKGLPDILRKKAFFSLSLSRLTFTHQICRLVLLEQLYRCFEIFKNSTYNK